ncbi:hypothetical protein ACJX0J_007458, partial [Zea mays]
FIVRFLTWLLHDNLSQDSFNNNRLGFRSIDFSWIIIFAIMQAVRNRVIIILDAGISFTCNINCFQDEYIKILVLHDKLKLEATKRGFNHYFVTKKRENIVLCAIKFTDILAPHYIFGEKNLVFNHQ